MAADRSSPPANFATILSRSGGSLAHLRRQAAELAALDGLLATLLPAPLSAHVRACAPRDGLLVLQVDSPAWATRLRLVQQQLIEQLRARPGLGALRGLHVTVAADTPPEPPPAREAKLSAAAARTLAQCAESQSDPALRDSLARLSRRT